jgi:hypothetical protein
MGGGYYPGGGGQFIPQIEPKPSPKPSQQPKPKPDEVFPPPFVRRKECEQQWEDDLARCDKIAKEMKERGYDKKDIAIWHAACRARASGRKQRCEDNLPDTLRPYPAPWE